MNKNITEEELLLRKRARRRLVGAVVLTMVAIIFLPLIFDEPRPDAETHEIDIRLFPKDDVNALSPLVVPPENTSPDYLDQDSDHVQSGPDVDALSDSSNALESPDSFADIDELVGDTLESHIPIPGIKPQLAAVVQTDDGQSSDGQPNDGQPNYAMQEYVIQLGAFSDQLKAQQHLDILRSNGLNAYIETHAVNGNVVARVRVGSFADRNSAENELERLRKLGLNGVVTSK